MIGAFRLGRLNPMSIIQVQHIQKNCLARFSSLIDMSDVTTTNAKSREDNFLSRALAAFVIAAVAKTDDETASQAIVDEYGDDGIDAFYFDRAEHIAYLVQSKWIWDGNGSLDVASVLKFIQGVNHLLEDKVAMMGTKMQAKSADIQDVLSDSQATFVFLVTYTGKQSLSKEANAPLVNLLDELNDDGDLVTLQVLKQKELHDIVEVKAMGTSVDLTVMLHEFGKVDTPYIATDTWTLPTWLHGVFMEIASTIKI
jgi:hypothetical protein